MLDAFENLFNNLSPDALDKTAQRALKSVGAIQRKLTRMLEARGLERLDLSDARAQVGLCKVVETRATEAAEEGTILAVVRNGYRRGEHVLDRRKSSRRHRAEKRAKCNEAFSVACPPPRDAQATEDGACGRSGTRAAGGLARQLDQVPRSVRDRGRQRLRTSLAGSASP